jgi:hypothetical protein
MTTSRSAGLVRRWVALYTLGLPADIRDARREEIEDDLWSQAHDSELVDGASADVLGRLVFGLWADITWRLEQRHRDRVRPVLRSATMGTRAVAAFAIIGGAAFVVALFMWVERPLNLADPLGYWAVFASFVAFGGLAIATWGLIALFNERMSGRVALLGAIGAFGSLMAALGALGAFILLPIGSAAVALDLARQGAMGRILAIAHASAAVVCFILVLVPIWTSTPIGGPLIYLILLYALSWIGIGLALRRGQLVIDQPSAVGRAP